MTEWRQVIQLMLVQLIHTLERRPEKYSPEGAAIKPTLLLLDEFPQYGKLDIFESAMRVLRSKNVTFSIFCQSIADLNRLYGRDGSKTLLENCSYQAVLGSNDVDTQKYFSEKSGAVRAVHYGISRQHDPYWQVQGKTLTASETIEPAIFPEEFAALAGIVLFHPGVFTFSIIEKAEPICEEIPIKLYKNGNENMANSTEIRIAKVEGKVKWLENRRRIEMKKEEEAKKKRIQHRRFMIGETFCEHFPDFLDSYSEEQGDRDVMFNSLKSILLMLSLDKGMVIELQEKAEEMTQLFSEEDLTVADEESLIGEELVENRLE